MKVEKIRDNYYRVRQQYKGKRYSIVFDHKPSQKEITLALAEKLNAISSDSAQNGSIDSFTEKYLNLLKERGKSPSTLAGYQSIKRNTPDWFLKINIYNLENADLQKLVTLYSKGHSPKSTRNMYGLYRAVLAEFRPEMILSIKLPPIEKKMEYEPSTKDVMAILEYAKGGRYSVFLQLSVLGLRRGEIGALSLEDLSSDNVLTINKDLIVNENYEYIIKESAKTAASNRRILIPDNLANEIRNQGYIFEGNLHTVNEYLHKAQDALDIPRFRLHILRHFAAAYLNKMGFTKDQILAFGGWEKGSSVMERVYSYNLDPEESQKDIAGAFSDLF